jgi:hypothetical protein
MGGFRGKVRVVSGFPAKTIGADVHDRKPEAFVVLLPVRDVGPASKRWEEMVEQMTEAHESPRQSREPPKKPGLSGAMEAYPETRNKVAIQQLAASWIPMTLWPA